MPNTEEKGISLKDLGIIQEEADKLIREAEAEEKVKKARLGSQKPWNRHYNDKFIPPSGPKIAAVETGIIGHPEDSDEEEK